MHLPPGSWTTVLDALAARFPRIDRAAWADRMARGLVQDVAGHALGVEAPYRAGLAVRYWREVPDETPIPGVERIVHQDADLLVADKPHFLPVMPAGRFVTETLLARLIRRTGNANLVPLHRIDRLTAGLVLFSTSPASRAAYQALFRERRITKRYEAIAPPLPRRSFPLRYCSRIERGEPFFRMREVVGRVNSEMRIEVLARGTAAWRYALYPHTGRKHQLRVTLAALGAPIRGDPWYPDLLPLAPDDVDRPLQLLAQALDFIDPVSGVARHFESTLSLPDLAS